MFSVVIPLYNKEKQIANTLRSVLSQTCQDFEVVVVDDGSTDNSVTEVRKIQDPRIRLISQKNAGVSAARNHGIEEARGKYIALLDADDEWKPDFLATQATLINKYPDCSIFATNYEYKNLNNTTRDAIINRLSFNGEDGVMDNYFEVAAHSNPPLWTSSIVVEVSAIKSIGGFPLGISSGEDLVTWAKLATKFQIAYNKKVKATFIESPPSSGNSKSKEREGGEDYIMSELLRIYDEETGTIKKEQIKEYLIFWHKLQSVLYIENYKSHKAVPLSIKAIKLGGTPSTFLQLICLGLLPPKLSRYIFFKFRR